MNVPSWTLLLVAALGFGLALLWSGGPSGRLPRRYAALALLLALSALEFFLLSSQLAVRLPAIALIGGVFPLLLGPLWWRAHVTGPGWTFFQWGLALAPVALIGIALLAVVGVSGLAWLDGSGVTSAQWLLLASGLSGLASRPHTARRPTKSRSHFAAD